ncbi:hypothetical protein [Devosia sp.]|uniref:hypothetical protein n=1 Tax=Devosia sp. TaxID=1871048 RepID=UPI00086CC36E|nr:hypothetical protein [Devosia sp.]ODT82989.1 MAG: hypothetical protein ABS76_05565 [Pelagibacterium sp. SCN 64-44]
MSAIRLVVTLATAAITVSRHPAVRAGLHAVAANPATRERAADLTRRAAYNAGVLARHIVGNKPR